MSPNNQFKDFNEDSIIKFLQQKFSSSTAKALVGIGDDTAVIKTGKSYLLLTKDLLIENTHFIFKVHPPYLLGRKCLNVNLSDIAAMGGKPNYCLIGLGLSNKVDWAWLQEFFAGVESATREFGLELVGGDLSRSSTVMISVTIVGKSKYPVLRSGAKPGDLIYVSGHLGEAAWGLKLLKKGYSLGKNKEIDYFIHRFLDPSPNLKLGQQLVRQNFISAMIDLSDGLSTDLRRLCQVSHCGAELWVDQLPSSPLVRKFTSRPRDLTLHGGEDYHLLFTVPASREAVFTRWQKKNKYQLFCCGRIIEKNEIYLVWPTGRREVLRPRGFRHFA
ncbi:MAG TPA: thiamine-phosphate kinase [Candidatus Aminicenantes bacterium]|nr:thiamine-phosphate kinase [Candidatus Aminicenantes bacterium]